MLTKGSKFEIGLLLGTVTLLGVGLRWWGVTQSGSLLFDEIMAVEIAKKGCSSGR